MLILSKSDISKLVSMKEVIKEIEESLKEVILGNVWMPPRISTKIENNKGWIGIMPCYIKNKNALGTKIVSDYPDNNVKFNLPTIMATMIISDYKTGKTLGIMNGETITSMRTGAIGGIAAKYLSKTNSSKLGVFGAGIQSKAQISAILTVRDIQQIKIYDKIQSKIKEFTKDIYNEFKIDIKEANPEQVANDSDIIVTATTSKEPILDNKWINNGTHINAIGAHSSTTREIDTQTVVNSKIVVDSIETAMKEAGEILIPIAENKITKKDIYGELGEIILNNKSGRKDNEEITLFKSCGLSVQDIATANIIYKRAIEKKVGRKIEI